MCLELFNPFLGLPLAWLGQALFAVVIALLAARSLFASPPKDATRIDSDLPGGREN